MEPARYNGVSVMRRLTRAVLLFFAFTQMQVITFAADFTVLFTNDMHSGGDYARLAALIRREQERARIAGEEVIVLDAGDIAMGSIMQTLYSESAFEYGALAKMGYTCFTVGNHDFDFGVAGFSKMIREGVERYGGSPGVVISNLEFPKSPELDSLYDKSRIIELKSGFKIGILGLLGDHAWSCIPSRDSLIFIDPIEAAKKVSDELLLQGADYIIALSHSGTLWVRGEKVERANNSYPKLKSETEDGKLARKVQNIDLIISGHDHELLPEPLLIGNTVIGSVGSGNCWLGKIVIKNGELFSYELIPVTEEIEADDEFLLYLDEAISDVERFFMEKFSVEPSDTISFAEQEFPHIIGEGGRMALGSIIAESYRSASRDYIGEEPVAIVPFGVIRKGIGEGVITYKDAYETLSLGVSEDGSPGYPLVVAWVTGEELYDICELNPSIAPGMEDAYLFFSGLTYSYNRFRLPFTRVTGIWVNGKEVDEKQLYPIVTGEYTARLIGTLKNSSYGVLSAIPKNSEGEEVDDIDELKVNIEGRYLQEWLAFASYIKENGMKSPAHHFAVDNSSRSIYLLYLLGILLFSVAVIFSISLLRSGRRAHCHRP